MLDKDKERASTNRRVKKFWKNHPDRRIQNSKKYKASKELAGKRRRSLLLELLSIKGSRCAVCGYNKNTASLEWHHLRDKSFTISQRIRHCNKNILIKEIEKCILLCCNCHRELHHPQCKIV